MSVRAESLITLTQTIDTKQYDHAINLVDATQPSPGQVDTPIDPDQGASDRWDNGRSRRESDGSLRKKWTKPGLREELARRKYARFQEGRYNGEGESASESNEERHRSSVGGKEGKLEHAHSRIGRMRDKNPFKSRKSIKAKKQAEYEVDILYENQRGMFLCGIPLYGSNSLLNFDPGPWQTSAFKDSPVNITNAQLPDPSWAWAWKMWYVDMSHDVDEEGWEYSLSFRQGFSWHGSHPWFHSFVRRRRWLRKRTKIHAADHGAKGSLIEGHMLNADYFTIHAAPREGSRGSSTERTTNHHSSFAGGQNPDSETEEDEAEISNMVVLMKALKRATVDRKKAQLFDNFLDHGGEELHYLAENMPEIMSLFIYQTSRRQLLDHLKSVYEELDRGPLDLEGEDAARGLKMNIAKAIQAAEADIRGLEFWSDASSGAPADHNATSRERGAEGFETNKASRKAAGSSIDGEIVGISDDAGLDEEPGLGLVSEKLEMESVAKGKQIET